jgi:radical SAM enzyme (TIGR01210 family)
MDRKLAQEEITISRRTIESLRQPKVKLDPFQPIAVIHEFEATARSSNVYNTFFPHAAVTSVFLTGAECTFRCTMCDLWKHTLDTPTPPGAIPAQIDIALQSGIRTEEKAVQSPQWIKLYNSSNFFDPRCVPPEDWDAIVSRITYFDRVIVENHPRLVDSKVGKFAEKLSGKLEVAMGLETVYEPSIRLLNKQMTLDDFERAARDLGSMSVDLRVFILLQPPGMPAEMAVEGVVDSLRFADHCGARHASIIATRGGNGMMERFSLNGSFKAPSAFALERCFDQALISDLSMVITVDLWDFEKLAGLCESCVGLRRERLSSMNLSQSILPTCELTCGCCDG